MIRRTSFHPVLTILFFFLVLLVIAPALASGKNGGTESTRFHDASPDNFSPNVQLGPRPFFLVEDMEPGELKNKLARCGTGPFRKTSFSIGHRGAPLQFPEHTVESYRAAARMGAGILECDVTFTRDKEGTGMPPFAVRSAHHHRYSGNTPCRKMHAAFYTR